MYTQLYMYTQLHTCVYIYIYLDIIHIITNYGWLNPNLKSQTVKHPQTRLKAEWQQVRRPSCHSCTMPVGCGPSHGASYETWKLR